MQRDGERGGRCPLVLVHRLAVGAGLGGGARDVEQHEHGEIAPPAQAVDVDRLVGRATRPSPRRAPRSPRRCRCRRPARCRWWRSRPRPRRASGRRRPCAVRRAAAAEPSVGSASTSCTVHQSVAVAPLRARPTRDTSLPASERGRLERLPLRRRRERSACASAPSGVRVRRRVGAGRTAAAQPAHRLEHPCEPAADAPPPPTGLEKGSAASSRLVARRTRPALGARAPASRPRRCAASVRSQHGSRAELSESCRRIGDRFAARAPAPATRRANRRGPRRPHRRAARTAGGSTWRDRRERAVAFHREVAPASAGRRASLRTTSGSRLPPRASDACTASASTCRARIGSAVDEDRDAVGPRRLAGLRERHLQRRPAIAEASRLEPRCPRSRRRRSAARSYGGTKYLFHYAPAVKRFPLGRRRAVTRAPGSRA